MGIVIILGVGVCGYLVYYAFTYKKYLIEVRILEQEGYKAWRWIGLGLYLLDTLPFHRFIKQPNYQLLQLCGKQKYSKKLRLFEAERLTFVIGILGMTLFLMFIFSIKNLSVQDAISLVRPSFGEGDKVLTYNYDLSTKNKVTNIPIIIPLPEQRPTKEQAQKVLENVVTELPEKILGNNASLNHVDAPLDLMSTYKEREVAIKWESQDHKKLLDTGEIRYNNVKDGDVVTLKAVIGCYGLTDERSYEVQLYHPELNEEEQQAQIMETIKVMFSRKNLKQMKEGVIFLPKNLQDYDANLKWYTGQKGISPLSVFLGGIVLAISFFYLKKIDLNNQIKKRQEELLRTFPECVNQFALLMNAGMTFNRAWEKITQDYLRRKVLFNEVTILYEEMLMTLEDMKKGVSDIKAYEAFGQRCKIPEILRFTSLIIQNTKKGSHIIIGALLQQSKEALSLRQDLARKKGEKASTKLIFPMGIMFLAILIIVITPAIITLKL
ncbi:MAG: type II secretion system F family protein [Vallitaleaceae bacterium]|nr:type II secretion system F family protein [Vallitaleaceae bacterium]